MDYCIWYHFSGHLSCVIVYLYGMSHYSGNIHFSYIPLWTYKCLTGNPKPPLQNCAFVPIYVLKSFQKNSVVARGVVFQTVLWGHNLSVSICKEITFQLQFFCLQFAIRVSIKNYYSESRKNFKTHDVMFPDVTRRMPRKWWLKSTSTHYYSSHE